jgi:hypothetical protein
MLMNVIDAILIVEDYKLLVTSTYASFDGSTKDIFSSYIPIFYSK